MEATKATNRIHPLVATAAVSVTLVSLVGIAAITGLLPNSHSSNPNAAPVATAPVVAPVASAPVAAVPPLAAAVAAPPATVAPAAPVEAPAAPAPAPVKKAASGTQQSSVARSTPKRAPQPQPDYRYSAPAPVVAQAPAICDSCGRIESVDAIQQEAKPSGLGVVAGAVLGGALGNQVGGGNGRKLATVAGAIGGGYAGNEIEKRTRSTTTYQVRVRMEDGSVRTIPYETAPGWHSGDRVRVVNGTITARG